MPSFDPHQIANLVGQLGGDHQQAAQALSNVGGQIDPRQHADMLQQIGVDPQRLQNGGYDQHLDNQNDPSFQGYMPGGDLSQQSPDFDDESGMGMGSGYGGQSGTQNF